ncbi:hypothetical protein ZIOFF_072512 [Zingiber officinale]|uniref:Uncharacterized protein n=1 Tax=Zingiber officinale TaxID=94328 RepID=A0A8J5C2I6_ZINOF|nr:hypothetical protein ZIOFF_072512 [Zingiber officinale]
MLLPLCEEAPLLPKLRGYFAEFLRESCLAPLGILYLPTSVGFGYRYPFVEGRSSFSWEYGMGYFRAVAPRTRTLARGISSTPSYPEKASPDSPRRALSILLIEALLAVPSLSRCDDYKLTLALSKASKPSSPRLPSLTVMMTGFSGSLKGVPCYFALL